MQTALPVNGKGCLFCVKVAHLNSISKKAPFMRLILALIAYCWASPLLAQDFSTRFERTQGKETATYPECIAYYKLLDKRYPQISMLEIGNTDAGFPLHLVIYSGDGDFNFTSIHKKNKRVILINNGIHPGEPDGVDASMMLLRDLAQGKKN